jgi:alpha/beta superfamily hydrolase
MSKYFYIIPGFGESTKDKPYRYLANLVKKAGYLVVPIEIEWDRTTITDWIDQANGAIQEKLGNEGVILGFSFGACVAAQLAAYYPNFTIIFASLSPYFQDNLKNIPVSAQKYFGKRRMESFAQTKFKPGNNKAYFLMGEKDWDYGKRVIKKRFGSWKGKKEIYFIPEIDHYIGHEEYLDKIEDIIKNKGRV